MKSLPTNQRNAIALTICLSLGIAAVACLVIQIEQMRPSTATVGTAPVSLEVAATQQQHERGLMGRQFLAPESGMIFLFRPARKVNLWMVNTLIPLDMIFVKNGKVEMICENAKPFKPGTEEVPRYPGNGGIEATEVIEVNSGFVSRHNIQPGNSVQMDLHYSSPIVADRFERIENKLRIGYCKVVNIKLWQ